MEPHQVHGPEEPLETSQELATANAFRIRTNISFNIVIPPVLKPGAWVTTEPSQPLWLSQPLQPLQR